jgi:3-hydroxy acid dehydrogenase/malonic semialdehyde reductase
MCTTFDNAGIHCFVRWLAMESVKDQIVFVTGASSGIGAACARVCSKNGAKAILNARRKERLEALAMELKEKFECSSFILPFDVRNLDQARSAIEGLPAEWERIDVLVNNAGLARGLDKLQEGRIEDWEEMVDSNIKGLLYTTRLIVPGMVKRGRGHVVNIASIAGIQTYPGGAVYCATKAAVRVLSEGLRQDLLGTPIRVTTISPGLVETEFAQVRFRGDRERAVQTYRGLTPLSADDVADAVLYAISRPQHVNVSEMVLFPTDQASATLVNRRG